ncbi:MAG TPA: ABC transporter ATP-binding protein [Thermoanaerobaculia bacterium]|nr:ABC transporter ATP-binding protein [Thermoanaerobaculia bacterium]
MIVLDGLHRSFGGKTALSGLSLVAEDGRVTGLLGPNGAGKTTALRALGGLLRPDSGRATLDGIDPAVSPREARRRLGFLPEPAGLPPRLGAREILAFAGEIHGLARRPLAARIDEVIAAFGLAPFAERPAEALSTGERRRVALARALVADPPNVVLDEPTNGLDVLGSRAVRKLVRNLAAAGKCVLLSSHHLREMAEVCDRVVVVTEGRAVAAGRPEDLLARTGKPDLESAFVDLIGEEGWS